MRQDHHYNGFQFTIIPCDIHPDTHSRIHTYVYHSRSISRVAKIVLGCSYNILKDGQGQRIYKCRTRISNDSPCADRLRGLGWPIPFATDDIGRAHQRRVS